MWNIIYTVLGVISCVLSSVCIVMLGSFKRSSKNDGLNEELRRNREEQAQSLRTFGEDTNRRIEVLGEKVERTVNENLKNSAELTNRLNQSFSVLQQQSRENAEKQARLLSESIAKMQESNEQKLEQMRATVDEKLTSTLTTRLDSSFKTVSEQLENVYKSLGEMKELSQGVTTNVSSLNRVLTNVKARGTWAEVQLGEILDQTIPGRYVTNYSPKNNSERVEFAVRFPSGEKRDGEIYLPIDSKFPMEDYVRVCDAADRADKEALDAARKALEDRVLSEAKDINSKYICVPTTTPFAVLYLATEGLYAEIASSRSGIAEKLQALNVMVAGPSTVTALLNSFSMGFKAIAINEKADEIRVVLGAAKAQYDKFGTVLEKAHKKIEEAGKTLEEAENRNRQIQKKLKSIEALDNESSESLLTDGIE